MIISINKTAIDTSKLLYVSNVIENSNFSCYYGFKITFQGNESLILNFDPHDLIGYDTPEEIANRARDFLIKHWAKDQSIQEFK